MPPASDGGSPILYYTLACASISLSIQIPAPATTRTVSGLTNGTEHQFTITATNANGTGPAATFLSVQPGVLPFGPSLATLSSLNASTAIVTWNLSTIANEGASKWFVVTVLPSTASMSSYEKSAYIYERARTFQIPSTNISYRFLVQAINDTGYCPPFAYTNAVQFLLNAPLAPTNLQGLQLWLDGADPLATGTAPTNGTSITTWSDKSGAGNVARAGGASTPTFVGGSNAISFDGAGYYSTNYSGSLSNESLFVVFRRTNVTPSNNAGTLFGTTGLGGRHFYTVTGNQNNLYATQYGQIVGTVGPVSSIAVGSTFIGELITNNNVQTSYVTGGSQGTSVSVSYTAGRLGFIGNTLNPSGLPTAIESYTGFLYEILGYSNAFNFFNRQKVEGYLAWKWGLQGNLPLLHSFRNDPPNVSSILSPSTISSMLVWLDASDPAYYTLSSSRVTSFRDKSGRSNNVSTIEGFPVLSNNVFNGRSAIWLNGVSTAFVGPLRAASSFTAFFVASLSTISGGGTQLLCLGVNGSGQTAYNASLIMQDTNTLFLRKGNEQQQGTDRAHVSAYFNSQFIISMAYTSNGIATSYLNGNFGSQGFTSGALSTLNYIIGRTTTSGGNWPGYMGEMLIFNSDLTNEDRQTTEGYLAWKWGLQGRLPITHPYKYDSPVAPYNPNATIFDGAVMNFRASDYISSSTWSNTTGGFGFSHNAVLTAGAISKNAANNGVFFSTGRMQISTVSSLTNFTMTSWFRRTGLFINSGGIISDTYGGNQINMVTRNTNIGLFGSVLINNIWYEGSTIYFPPNTWRQMTFSWNNTTKQMKTYLNSTLIHTSTFSSAPTPSSSGGVYYIGAQWDGTQSITSGDIGQVLVYNRALSDSEVVYNYNITSSLYQTVPTPSTQLILQYTAATYSGSGPWTNTGTLGTAYNATILSGTPSTIGTGNGIVFNNSLIYQIPNFGQLYTYTQMFWFKRIGPTGGLMSQRYGGGPVYFTAIAQGNLTSSMFARIYYNNNPNIVTSSVVIVPDTWYNLAYVWNGSSFITYVNGLQTVSNAFPNIVSEQSGDVYYIGSLWDQSTRLRAHLGEVRLYNGPLTSSQILSVYQTTSTSYSNVPISTQMVIYYDATSYTGSGSWSNLGTMGTAYNASTFSGTPAKNPEGNGVRFNGSLIFSVPNFGTIYNYTQSIWFKRNAIARTIMSQRYTSGNEYITLIGRADDARGMYGSIYNNGVFYNASTLTIDTDTWYNITYVWNGSAMFTYLNGVQVGSNAFAIYNEENGNEYYIGNTWFGTNPFIGDIGEVRVYNGPLTSSQVLTLYTSTSTLYPSVAPSTQMLLYYSGTNYTGSGAWSNLGSLGTSRNASIVGGTPSKNAAGNGVVFSGSLYYRISSLNVSLPDFTVATWFKRTTASIGSDTAIFTQGYPGSGAYMNLMTRRTVNDSTVVTSLYSSAYYDSAPITTPLNTWVHIAATYNGSTMRTYSNGVLTSTTTYSNVFAENNGTIWYIGSRYDGTQYTTGQIGEIRLYRGVLEPSSISTLYGSTLTATFSV